jgi:DNA repair protein RecN (Recombination protein N)
MLRYLKISNLAIIDEVEVEFREGFNVLTGETGAGKSILVGALNLLMGIKVSDDIIRAGAEEARVEALFEIPDDFSFPCEVDQIDEDTREIVLSRRVFRSRRSRCFINGSLATQALLRAVGGALVSIFGQHEHQTLLNPQEHVEILDRTGNLETLRKRTSDAYYTWTHAVAKLAETKEKLAETEQQGADNAEAVEELTKADLKPDEEDELTAEREILRKAVQIRERAFEAHQALYSRSGSIMEGLSEIRKAVEYLVQVNPKLTPIQENLEEATFRLEDVALELRDVAETSSTDPSKLERIEERLVEIRRLKRKYGLEIEDLLEKLESLSEEAGLILDFRADVKKWEEEVRKTRDAYLAAAKKLSRARKAAAATLETAVKTELQDLAMAEASFQVMFHEQPEDEASPDGLERIEFFLASNPGESPKPLAKIASGGELSRIMLAVKALQLDGRTGSTVIFDEVDAGIGGRTAKAVGGRLARVASRQQVLCVTHLHQIAALAGHHLSVSKMVDQGRTKIHVERLEQDRRVDELARMLGAESDSETAREHVRQLMET